MNKKLYKILYKDDDQNPGFVTFLFPLMLEFARFRLLYSSLNSVSLACIVRGNSSARIPKLNQAEVLFECEYWSDSCYHQASP